MKRHLNRGRVRRAPGWMEGDEANDKDDGQKEVASERWQRQSCHSLGIPKPDWH